MNSGEGAGRTVEEAIRNALRVLGAKREDVDLMVLDEGSRGVLGLGSREARVRVTLLSAIEAEEAVAAPPEPTDDPVAVARRITVSVVEAMGIGATVTARADNGAVLVTVAGPQLAPLIGRRGQTLEALDFLVNLMTTRQLGRRVQVAVDAERYRERRRETLQALAGRTAGRVRRGGGPVALDPMPASERRFIHTLLAEDAHVMTYSEGDGAERHVVIAPKGTMPPASAARSDRSHAGQRSTGPAERGETQAVEDDDQPEGAEA